MIFAAALSLEIDALGSDLFLLLMNIGFAALHLGAWGTVKGSLDGTLREILGWFLLNQAIDVPACRGVLAWGE